jgi:acyl-coenzyme A thioesterase PaaI-like protein
MRSLIEEKPTAVSLNDDLISDSPRSAWYENNHERLKESFHSRCLFKQGGPVENLRFSFTDNGDLHGTFRCDGRHEGYDGKVHGGILAAIIDASMTQCLMGHGIAGYTGKLSIRYRGPVALNSVAEMETRLVNDRFDKYYEIETAVLQDNKTCVTAKAKFLKITQ